MASRRKLAASLAAWRWVIGVSFRADRVRAALALAPVVPLGAVVIALASRGAIDAYLAGQAGQVAAWAAVSAGGLLTVFAAGYWQGTSTLLRLRESAALAVDEEVMRTTDAICRLDVLASARYADAVERLRGNRRILSQGLSVFNQIIVSAGLVAGFALLLGLISPVLLLFPAAAVAAAVIYSRAQRVTSAAEAAAAEPQRASLHLYNVGTGSAEGKELRVYGTGPALADRFGRGWRAIDAALTRAAMRAAARRAVAWALTGAALWADLWELGHVRARGAPPGIVFLTIISIIQLSEQSSRLAAGAAQAEQLVSLASEYTWLRETARSLSDSPAPAAPPESLGDGIRLAAADFAYPGAAEPVLRGVEAHLRPGEVVAIVGRNGAGKSTLVGLLTGLLRPARGQVLVDGTPLDEIPPRAWLDRVAAVSQDYARFEFALRECAGAGCLPRLGDDAWILAALDRAGAAALAHDHPQGLDRQLGTRLGGADLSSGEWQRVAIARALSRPRPLLLVLDEPAAALDALVEQEIIGGLIASAREAAAASGAVVVIVSHRYATARAADRVLLMDGGRIAENGSHRELAALGGSYARAYRAQADVYR